MAPVQPDQARRRSAAGWWLVLVSTVTLIFAATFVVVARPWTWSSSPPPPVPDPTVSSSPSPSRSASTPTISTRFQEPVPQVGPEVVVVRTDKAVYRVTLATGEVVRTRVKLPPEDMTVVALRDQVVIKPRWSRGGVRVPYGRPAVPLSAAMQFEAMLHPGPDDDLWLVTSMPQQRSVITRWSADGKRAPGAPINVPPTALFNADARGSVLLHSEVAGHYRMDGAGWTRVDRGRLVAAGPNHFLVYDCDAKARCELVRVDRRTSVRSRLALTSVTGDSWVSDTYGLERMSPDGRHLTRMGPDGNGVLRLQLLDLDADRLTTLDGAFPEMDANDFDDTQWSADSRWALVILDRKLHLYDVRERRQRVLDYFAEPVLQIAQRL